MSEKYIPVVDILQHNSLGELYSEEINDSIALKNKAGDRITIVEKTSGLITTLIRIKNEGNFYGIYLSNRYINEGFYRTAKGKNSNKKFIKTFSYSNDENDNIVTGENYIVVNEVLIGESVTETFYTLDGKPISMTKYGEYNKKKL